MRSKERESDRIPALDFLRGVAIIGMLIPNIPWHAGDSMSRVHQPDFASVAAWLSQYLVFDQRFMPIFCMLFGAGVALLHERRGPHGFGRYMLVRNALLLCIGIAHAYLLWPGDILITYAFCSPFVVVSLGLSNHRLLTLALLLKGVDIAFAEWPSLYAGTIERGLFEWWWKVGPPPSTIGEAYAGSYVDLFRFNAWRNQSLQWLALLDFRMWNALAFMLVGIALFRTGLLQGSRSARAYRSLTLVAAAVGGPFVLYGVFARIGINPAVGPWLGFTETLPLSKLTFSIGCAISSFGVLGLTHVLYPWLPMPVRSGLEAVGRMALTNYLLQSAVFILLFHGFAVLPFDTLDPDAFALMALFMTAIHLGLSAVVMKTWGQGPVEALWRWATARVENTLPRTGPGPVSEA